MGPQPRALASIALLVTLISAPARAFSLAPLRLTTAKGILQLSNPSDRSLTVSLQVFGLRQLQGRTTADLMPVPLDQAEAWIRIRPSQVRLSPGASRTISYSVLDPSQHFYLCGVSAQGLFTVRVCSRWRAQHSSAAPPPLQSSLRFIWPPASSIRRDHGCRSTWGACAAIPMPAPYPTWPSPPALTPTNGAPT